MRSDCASKLALSKESRTLALSEDSSRTQVSAHQLPPWGLEQVFCAVQVILGFSWWRNAFKTVPNLYVSTILCVLVNMFDWSEMTWFYLPMMSSCWIHCDLFFKIHFLELFVPVVHRVEMRSELFWIVEVVEIDMNAFPSPANFSTYICML
jgi:hypothetical protein